MSRCCIVSLLILHLSWVSMVHAYDMGRFTPSPVTSFYIVNQPGSMVQLELDLLKASRKNGDHVTIRIFDPAEKLVFWKHVEIGKLSDGEFGLGTMEVDGIGGDLLKPLMPEQLIQKFSYEMDKPGVYQVRVVAGSRNAMVKMQLSRELPWGVSCQNGDFVPWDNQPQKLHLFVPPHTRHLSVSGYGVSVTDDKQQVRYDSLASISGRKQHRIDITETGKVWTMTFANVKRWELRAWEMPLILCNTPEAASQIKASITQTADGTVVSHSFQADILALRPNLVDRQRVGDTEQLLAQTRMTEAHKQAMLADAQRCSILFNGNDNFFQRVDYFIRSQNLDPTSHWAGSVTAWREHEGKPGLDGRWDHFEKIPGTEAGISQNYQTFLAELIWLVNLDEPFNPYFGRKELIHRAIAAAVADLLRINEAERFAEIDADPYPGGTASFTLGRKVFPVYRAAMPYASPQVASLWTEALQRVVDRTYPDGLVSTRNQSAHYLLVMDDYAQGSGLKRYEQLARRYAQRFVAGASNAGYQMEAAGPDATYIGMTRWHEAAYYVQSGDATILDSLRKSSDFFMHTLAPEPDGTVRGGFNFAHRTASGFYRSQWGDARDILYDVLPDVALWHRPVTDMQQARRSVEQGLTREPETHYRWLGQGINIMKFRRFDKSPATAGVWPALQTQDFIRNFGDELIAVKRPGYFTSIYVGKPAGGFYIRDREKLRPFYPNDAENNGGKIGGLNHRPQTPLVGGGMTLLSSPAYGSALLATNCSPLTYHGPVAVSKEHLRYWADYLATQFKLDEKAATLSVNGKIEMQPISYQRDYTFNPDAIEIRVTYTATTDTTFEAFFENIPVAMGNFKPNGALITINGQQMDQTTAREAQLRDQLGNGFDLDFESNQLLTIVRNGLIEDWAGKQVQFGRIQVQLPTQWRTGDTTTIKYRLKPVVAR